MIRSRNLAVLILALALLTAVLTPAVILARYAVPLFGASSWLDHLRSTVLYGYLGTSMVVAAGGAAVALVLGGLPAWLVSRYRFRGCGVVALNALLPLLFPPYLLAGIYASATTADIFLSTPALALYQGMSCSPFVFLVLRIAFARIPRVFGEAARTLGAAPLSRLFRLYLPLFALPVVAALLLVAAEALSDYGTAERVGIDTFSVGLHNLWFGTNDSDVALLLSFLFLVPVLALVLALILLVAARTPENPVVATGCRSDRAPLGTAGAATALALSCASLVPGLLIPLGCALLWATRWWKKSRFEHIGQDLANSLGSALLVVVLVLAVCLVTLTLVRVSRRAGWLERLPWLCLANYFLPSLVLALVFLKASADGTALARWLGGWRDTRVLLVTAVALRLLPFALLPLLDRLARIPPTLLDAARTLGLGPVRAHYHATFRAVRPVLAAGSALVFIEAVKELTLSLTLQPFGYSALALRIYNFTRFHNTEKASLWILLLCGILIPPVLVLHRYLERE